MATFAGQNVRQSWLIQDMKRVQSSLLLFANCRALEKNILQHDFLRRTLVCGQVQASLLTFHVLYANMGILSVNIFGTPSNVCMYVCMMACVLPAQFPVQVFTCPPHIRPVPVPYAFNHHACIQSYRHACI
jgi:hypothetical protein